MSMQISAQAYSASPPPPPPPGGAVPSSLTEDGFLGGRLRVLQPEKGYRAGIDAVFLAATIPCAAGETVYQAGDKAGDIFIVVSGKVEHALEPGVHARDAVKTLAPGGVFGWAALLDKFPSRLAQAACVEATELIHINGEELLRLLETDPDSGDIVMSRFATMITRDYTVPDLIAQVRSIHRKQQQRDEGQRFSLIRYQMLQWLKSPRPYLMALGIGSFLLFWYLAVEVWKLPRFREMPGITTVFIEWTNRDPVYGLSLFKSEYYTHIGMSVWRVTQAFLLATVLGVPFGLFLGWSKNFKEFLLKPFEVDQPGSYISGRNR